MRQPALLQSWMHRSHEKIRATKNILSPLQWILGISIGPCASLIIWGPAEYRIVFALTILGLLAYICIIYGAFAIFAPDRLQSEEHRENMTVLSQPYQTTAA
jgi:hypothetical protein